MHSNYFNHVSQVAEGWWGRRDFLNRWWRLYAGDRRWAPPHYRSLYRALVSEQVAHVARQHPALIYVEALYGRSRRTGETGGYFSTALMEEPVAATALLADPRRRDATANLGLLAIANDEESLDRLLATAFEQAWAQGRSRLVGPVGLSPYLQAGALADHFNVLPPLHTPYNPPYLPDVLEASMTPVQTTRLYQVEVNPATAPASPPPGPARLTSLDPARLAGDLLPLLVAAVEDTAKGASGEALFPPPDTIEAEFLVAWWGVWPLIGRLAEVEGQPVGFVLLQPDLAGPVRWAGGGRSLLRRPWLAWRSRRPVQAGRLLAGGVLPAWRGRGIGRQLWVQALHDAAGAGWRRLTIGPLRPDSPAAHFLAAHGATAQQSYTLYVTEG